MFASHLTAARLLDLPNPLGGWRRLEFTRERGSARSRPDLRISVAALGPGDVVQIGSLPVTSPARTVIDCLRTLPPRDGLAIADAAAHLRLVAVEELWCAMNRQYGWPGSAVARKVLELVDGRRESPLESWSAWGFEQMTLPRPDWQHDLFTPGGVFLGRCDAWWPGVAGEADGRSKYRLAAAERGGVDADTLFAILDDERARHEGIRRAGFEVVRWGSADVLQAARLERLAGRIRAAIQPLYAR